VFLSTFEKQLDSKRRIVVPQDFRAALSGPFDGVMCFPSFEADCLEGGGQALFNRYEALIEELPFGDPLRTAIEVSVRGGLTRMAFDTAGRITLPEAICEQFNLDDWVTVIGMGERFQIWNRDAFRTYREEQRLRARGGLAELRASQRPAKTA
jgi:MraZ protein